MKKILIIHTNYQEFGGEDQSVKNEINLLKNHYEGETLIETNNITSFFNDFFAILFRINFKFEKTLELIVSGDKDIFFSLKKCMTHIV